MFSELLDKLFKRDKDNSRNDVKQRLQLLLAHDRADITPQILEKIRREIVEVVSKYVEIDDEGLEFMLESDQRLSALVVNFPIRRIRSDEEERKPVATTKEPIALDEDGGAAAENFSQESSKLSGKSSGKLSSKSSAAKASKTKALNSKSSKRKSAAPKHEGSPPEVKIALDDDIPSNMNLDLDAGLGSTPASE